MGLDQHFFKYPIPDPLPPKWSQEAQDTVTELQYIRGRSIMREAIFSVTETKEDAYNGEPFIVTREQLGKALMYIGPDSDEGWDRLELTRLLLVHPDEQFVYLASW